MTCRVFKSRKLIREFSLELCTVFINRIKVGSQGRFSCLLFFSEYYTHARFPNSQNSRVSSVFFQKSATDLIQHLCQWWYPLVEHLRINLSQRDPPFPSMYGHEYMRQAIRYRSRLISQIPICDTSRKRVDDSYAKRYFDRKLPVPQKPLPLRMSVISIELSLNSRTSAVKVSLNTVNHLSTFTLPWIQT